MSRIERFNGVLDQLPAALGAHDQTGSDLPQLNHIGDLNHAVEQAEAGIRDVVNHALRRESQQVMHAARRGRFQMIPTDTAVNQCSNVGAVDPHCLDGFVATLNALVAGQRSGRPEAAFANPRHVLQAAFRQAQPPVERLQATLDVVARHHFLGQRIAKRLNTDVLILHEGSVPRGTRRGDFCDEPFTLSVRCRSVKPEPPVSCVGGAERPGTALRALVAKEFSCRDLRHASAQHESACTSSCVVILRHRKIAGFACSWSTPPLHSRSLATHSRYAGNSIRIMCSATR